MKNTNLITPGMIQQAKAVSIVRLLQSIGAQPLREMGNELIYLSPLRNEKTPSFFVNPDKNCFTDFGGDEDLKGDTIRLARLIWNVGFKEAVQRLLNLEHLPIQSFSFSGLESQKKPQKGINIICVRKLQHPALLSYVNQRGISFRVANQYLKEVTYETNGKQFFAVGFQNEAGGFELRNGLDFKGGKTLNGITVFKNDIQSESVAIFEGFFDFLSVLEHYGKLYPKVTTIVLNTCNNLNRALPLLTNRKQIHCYLDNDQTGRKTLEKLRKLGHNVKDWAQILYPNCKDMNDYLIQDSANWTKV